jgi:hypothetical protein
MSMVASGLNREVRPKTQPSTLSPSPDGYGKLCLCPGSSTREGASDLRFPNAQAIMSIWLISVLTASTRRHAMTRMSAFAMWEEWPAANVGS